jgi:hypothetical protein
MKITLSPQRRDDNLQVIKSGDTLTINGTAYDFSVVPDGATLPRDAVDCPWLASDVERIDDVLHLTLLLPHGPNAPEETRFPSPLVNPADGVLELPLYDTPVVVEESPEELAAGDEELTE